MEAVRPAPAHTHTVQQLHVDADELPPPPAPFPVDQLVASESTDDGGVSQQSERSKQNVRNYLASVQQSCINALSSLLPSESSSSSNISPSTAPLPAANARLAAALTGLLEVTYELDDLLPPSTNITPSTVHTEAFPDQDTEEDKVQTSFNALTSLLEGLQHARSTDDQIMSGNKSERNQGGLHPAINVVREELAWQRLESLSTAVVGLSQGRVSSEVVSNGNGHTESNGESSLPPAYQQYLDAHTHSVQESDNSSVLPAYHDIQTGQEAGPSSPMKTKPNDVEPPSSPLTDQRHPATREKMMLELDSLTSAIERLSSVAPRLHDQRVEMRHASSTRSKSLTTNGDSLSKEDKIKLERQKMKELEEIWDKIERAHGKRRIRVEDGQRADGEGWERRTKERFINRIVDQAEARRLDDQDSIMGTVDAELARARDLRDRDHFLRDLIDSTEDRRLDNQDATIPKTADRKASLIENLIEYSSSGRLHDQDSLPPTPRYGINGEKVEDPFELVTVQDFLASTGPDRRRSLGGDALFESVNGEGSVGMGRSRSNSKIAGMMRRGSGQINLGLKANNGIDANNIAFIAEHQENLRAVQITLHGVGISSNLELQLETGLNREEEAIISSKKDPSISVRIALPTPIQPGQSVSFTPQSLHLEAKLVAQPIPASAVSLLPSYPLSAPDLRTIRPKVICCTSCERELASLPLENLEQAYKDLPSEHWAEMMEVWMCHNDPSFTARLSERTKEGFWPQNGGVLVGGSYLLIGHERINETNIDINVKSDNQTEPWNRVFCRCGEVLGKQRSKDEKPGSGTLRLSKWAVVLLKEDDEYVRFPLSVFVVSDMLELSQAHASHRFIVSEDETGDKRVYMWLFNPSVKMSYARSTEPSPMPSPLRKSIMLDREEKHRVSRRSSIASSIGGKSASVTHAQKTSANGNAGSIATQRVLRAAKIMYKVVDQSNDTELDELPGFGAGGQVESLSYPAGVCDRLIASLRESSMVYPVGRRSMGAFDVGFLERI
ncbi:uncharacterized protein I303_102700 [Kwoniella dejecticola CBS 10117]|uniref:HECT domain-containing protein n=1 Tax=Kwoniella dejecticola CBS 10117 TaxID=1296121 RepID=A0A1A6A9H8_9TREE|nr:uncharacterized protein I303_02715 [Kwoniella dejecticola CBS 10117]OBR86703.1 hypothetical protein I303_02715 [Kwoniella dejecticola CBS 10117]